MRYTANLSMKNRYRHRYGGPGILRGKLVTVLMPNETHLAGRQLSPTLYVQDLKSSNRT